jgi:hypothetical protein
VRLIILCTLCILDAPRCEGIILVEKYKEGHCEVCGAMLDQPASEDGALETGGDE